MIARRLNVSASAAGNVTVNHNLGYVPSGWMIEKPGHATAAFSVVVDTDTTSSKTSVDLIFSGAGSCVLAIW